MHKPEERSAPIGKRVTPQKRNYLLGAQVEGFDVSLGVRDYPVRTIDPVEKDDVEVRIRNGRVHGYESLRFANIESGVIAM